MQPETVRPYLLGPGLGLMMTKALVENGAERVYIIGRREDKLDEAAQYNPK